MDEGPHVRTIQATPRLQHAFDEHSEKHFALVIASKEKRPDNNYYHRECLFIQPVSFLICFLTDHVMLKNVTQLD